jgi:hypothetical protein
MCSLPKEEVQKRLLFRNLFVEVASAGLSIEDPVKFDRIERLFHLVKSENDFFEFAKREVLPVVRQKNPYGYFDLLSSKSDEEIFGILLLGKLFGYDKEWLD